MKSIITLIVFLFIVNLCHSQKDSLKIQKIKIKSYYIDCESSKEYKNRSIDLDSISLNLLHFKKKIQVFSVFCKSNSELKTEFYFENNKIILIRFSEISPNFKNDKAIKFVEYYYENKKLLKEKYYSLLPSTAICSGILKEKSFLEIYGYKPKFTNKFLHFYAKLLLKKISM